MKDHFIATFKLIYEHINGGIEEDLEIMTIVQQKARQWAKVRMHVANHIIAHCNLLMSNKNHEGKEVGCQEGLIGNGKKIISMINQHEK